MREILKVRELKKSFGDKVVVNSISFSVERGSLFAFLGQNGAGKTTTINMAIGLMPKDGGEVIYDNTFDFSSYKEKIGVVFQNNILDDLLTVEENLLTYGVIYLNTKAQAKARLEEIVELLSMKSFLKQRFKTLSGGQKRKAEIARALFMAPEILFLDEPTTGLDPKTRAEVWSIINKLRIERKMTIFLTTHYMEEAGSANYVAIIDKGNIVATGSPNELKTKYTYDRLIVTPIKEEEFLKQLEILKVNAIKVAKAYEIRIKNTINSITILNSLKNNILFYEVLKGSMDDVFLSVVGEKILGGEAAYE